MSDLFIIGSSQPETAVGNQLREAANDLGLKAQLFEIADGHGTGLSRRLTYNLATIRFEAEHLTSGY